MNNCITGGIAILLYLSLACWTALRVFNSRQGTDGFHLPFLVIGSLAILTHAILLYQDIITAEGWNLGVYIAFSLMSWGIALFTIITAVVRPVGHMAIVFLPITAVAIVLELFLSTDRILSDTSSIGLLLHILLSITAYSLLTIAALQSVLLAIQEYQLHNKHPLQPIRLLPPMQTMEELLIQILLIGFLLLSLSLGTGMMFIHDIFGQHLAHKIAFSTLAWLIFGLVLVARFIWGWRGKILIRWVLGGFISLALAYFGSKVVLEIILDKV